LLRPLRLILLSPLRLISRSERNPRPISRSAKRGSRKLKKRYGDLEIARGSSCNLEIALSFGAIN